MPGLSQGSEETNWTSEGGGFCLFRPGDCFIVKRDEGNDQVLARSIMKIRGADFVMYPVSDLGRAAGFYRQILGLRQDSYSEEWQWAEFDCGNITLALKAGEKLPGPVTGARLALAVDDLQAAHEQLKKQAVHIVSAPVNYGVCWAMEVLDPDGNPVILHQRADGTSGPDVPPGKSSQP